ncbi:MULTISPECIES: metal-dependent transcriptional regulator [unclassified Mucilaginibacter]|uniref:metal-dependent transcriptional regulator n=1 Tax=unclassified Mucilaginibacter TaxID=2617802 RepID=UPI000871ABBE|nr:MULTISPECIES: metal-dependent transcriptional regulator [unclassified Mucilaginibacter]NVM64281.1 DtxR family Mn-dependent transcriptional regulator [Mucilaginibacter sp. SG538B]WDZ99168.1 metal-dependent transcriptional regulator [Mucilaginibacter sp. SJ]SCW76362.1 iron (metal) dependent repressor, DtxR family [Mucilaginibacter sp. NFR10]
MYTLSEENYLKAIYRLALQGKDFKITPTAIAESLSNNPASVVDMIRKLTEKQLIEYDKKNGVRLTQQGLKDATLIVRRHRLWEVFLLEKLGYHWDEIHDIAEELEHINDATLADRLDKFLGFPEYDPHGDPIPKANGKVPKSYSVSLSELKPGAQSHVAAVRDTSSSFLQYLQRLNIGIGTKIQLIEKIPYDSSLVIKIENRGDTTVSQKFGENILVD